MKRITGPPPRIRSGANDGPSKREVLTTDRIPGAKTRDVNLTLYCVFTIDTLNFPCTKLRRVKHATMLRETPHTPGIRMTHSANRGMPKTSRHRILQTFCLTIPRQVVSISASELSSEESQKASIMNVYCTCKAKSSRTKSLRRGVLDLPLRTDPWKDELSMPKGTMRMCQ